MTVNTLKQQLKFIAVEEKRRNMIFLGRYQWTHKVTETGDVVVYTSIQCY
jgi:hypothetical protein